MAAILGYDERGRCAYYYASWSLHCRCFSATTVVIKHSLHYLSSLWYEFGIIQCSHGLADGHHQQMDKAPQSITSWADKSGAFNRAPSQFRNAISTQPGAEFPPEKNRYHLYVSYACPWGGFTTFFAGHRYIDLESAHRTLIVRKLKGLEDTISYTSVHWEMLEKGWRFATPEESVPGDNVTPDPVNHGVTHLRDIYFKTNPDYEGRFLVPTLFDVKQGKIVSNESSEIIRMFYTEFDEILPEKYRNVDLFPKGLQQEIEGVNGWTYNDINNGVYKSGFAQTQEAYEQAVKPLFASLDRTEAHLAKHAAPYYFGSLITEADIRLFTTIIRFDPVYVQHFKCNIRDIRSGYPALHRWLRHLYWDVPAFGETTRFEHIKKHYTKSHRQINPAVSLFDDAGPYKDAVAVKW
ncbi:MAG: hypothetical protein Q9216_001757 [Gyalolechia sp. 2 TL-2023]